MHDLGDLMVQQGFSDPVMDQETLTLTYDTQQRCLPMPGPWAAIPIQTEGRL